MATTRRAKPGKPDIEPPTNTVTQLELAGFLQKRSVHELVIVEVAPGAFRIEAIIAWRFGRWTMRTDRGPRTFRSLDTLAKHLKMIGAGHTVTRIELLA